MLRRGDNPVADSEIVCKSDTAHTELRIECIMRVFAKGMSGR